MVLYEVGDFIDSPDDRILINSYRNFIQQYNAKLSEVFMWFTMLPRQQLSRLRLSHQRRSSTYFESIMIRPNHHLEGECTILVFKNDDFNPPLYKTLRLIGRSDYD